MAIGQVLAAAQVNQWDAQTRRGKAAARLRLLDAGDHVEWTDGETTAQWVLPDQASGRPDLPVLASIVRAEYDEHGRATVTRERLYLIDAEDNVLAILITADFSGLVGATPEDIDRLWPRGAFAALEERGVAYSAETFDDVAVMAARYHGSVRPITSTMMSRRSADLQFKFALGLLIVLIAIGLIWWLTQN
jgi:hypothetical protein